MINLPAHCFPKKKNESFQYNAALAIKGNIKGCSHGKLYQQLGPEYPNKLENKIVLTLQSFYNWSAILLLLSSILIYYNHQ